MSLILDALRKSEQERQGHGGTGLPPARVTAARQGLPWWAVALAGVLLLNLGLLAWLLWRPATPVTPAATAPTPAAVMSPVAAAPAAPSPTEAAGEPPPRFEYDADFAPAVEGLRIASGAAPAAAVAAPLSALPALDRVVEQGLPTVEQGNAGGAGIPALQVNLHIYADQATQRVVMLNGQRLREGESTPEGVRVERITESGLVLAWRGRQFSLSRGD
ncbi:MAG: hypothetical protein RL026_37 [Pseudomonadota bacterium]|jgi:general secretion pathway protein B